MQERTKLLLAIKQPYAINTALACGFCADIIIATHHLKMGTGTNVAGKIQPITKQLMHRCNFSIAEAGMFC